MSPEITIGSDDQSIVVDASQNVYATDCEVETIFNGTPFTCDGLDALT